MSDVNTAAQAASQVAQQIAELETAIAAQEALRPSLGDAVVEITTAALRAQLEALQNSAAATKSAEALPAQEVSEGEDRQPDGGPLPEERLALLRSYLPKELADKMRAIGRIEGERRQVTVLFAEIGDMAALSESFDPEEVVALTNEALKVMAEAVYQYEGYIDKFVGNAVMAVFGAPVAHEDDAERALRTALAMRERVEDFNRRWAERLGRPLPLHVGVNTGLVVADNVGSDQLLSYTVMGDTVNTASRLQSAANPGQILVSRNTYRLAREAFTFVALEPIAVKGKQEPLPVYELQRAKIMPSRVRGVQELASAFVGRDQELTQLHALLNDLTIGRGRVLFVIGEAGIGKSRLMAEWREEVGNRAFWLEGRAFSHTTSLSYGPFLDLLRRYAGIRDDDSEAQARERLHATVERFFPGDVEAHAMFVNLVALQLTPEESEVLARFPAQNLRQRLFGLWEQLLTRMSREHPVLLVIEDVHWADVTSLELIEHLSAVTMRMPVSLVGVMRPSGVQALADLLALLRTRCGDRFSTLTLGPLTRESGLEMAQRLLLLGDLPKQLRLLIADKTEGNPFYVEEVIRSLIERGALARGDDGNWAVTPLIDTVTVPDTLRGVLMARLDRLPAETKWLAQQASVIGRIFLYRVLLQMAEAVGDVDTDLDKLEREELIRMGARHPEVEYIFRHALTQEVAYESLLASRRKELHRRVGEAMEQVFAQRLGEFHSIIGEHFLRGNAWDRAIRYLLPAGDAAARLYAHPEARLHYNNVLTALSHLPGTVENRRTRVDVLIKYVSISWGAEPPEKNFQRLVEAEALLKELPGPDGTSGGDQHRLARVHYWMGRIQYMRRLPREAIDYYQQVLSVAQTMNDPELIAIPSSFIGQALVVQGHYGKAEPLLQQAIEPLERLDNLPEWIRAVSFHGICLAARGDYAQGLAEAQRTLVRAREANFLGGIALSNIYLSYIYFIGQDYARMVEASSIVIEAAQQTGDRVFVYLGYGFRAWAEGRLGRAEAARKDMDESQEIGKSVGGQLLLTELFAAADAELYLLAGNAEEAITVAKQAIKAAQVSGSIFSEGMALRVWGRALATLQPSRWGEAEAHLAESIRLFEAGDACIIAAHTHMEWGALCRERGDIAAAREHFTSAAEQYESSELKEALVTAQRLLSELPVHA